MSNQYLKQVDNILQHEVSRGEFIRYIGVAFVGMLGVTHFIKNLHDNVKPKQQTITQRSSGYGKSAYGR